MADILTAGSMIDVINLQVRELFSKIDTIIPGTHGRQSV